MAKRICNHSEQLQVRLCGSVLALGVGLVVALAPAAVYAESGHGLSARFGVGDDYKRVELAWNSPSVWSTTIFSRRLDLNAELGLAYWYADRKASSANVWQFTATPMFRYWLGERWFIEAGIGPAVFSSTRFAGEDLGSTFQFADQIGVGLRLSSKQQLSLRYSHYSNAGLKRPNPGLDVIQLNYTYLF